MRTILLILFGFLLTSCGSYQLSTINHTPEYIGDVRVDKIESRIDLNWKLRTDNQFRWDFANYAQNQPLSWYYDNSWELGLYKGNFTSFDFYWNRNHLWWDWASGYSYNYGWNSWYPFGYDRWAWNYGFGNSWNWRYNPYRWNYGFNRTPYIYKPNRNRNVVVVKGRRGSNTTNININRGRSNIDITTTNKNRVRTYRNPNRDYNDIRSRVRTPINNRNSNPIRVTPPTRTRTTPNVRTAPTRVTKPNISRGSSTSGRSSSSVIRRNND